MCVTVFLWGLPSLVTDNDIKYFWLNCLCSGRDANSIVKSDTSTTSSNHIRVSDGSASSGNSTKAEIVMAQQATDTLPAKQLDATNPLPISRDNVSADYDEIEEDKTEEKQKGGTIQSAADSTLSTVSSFNSSMRDSALDGTLLYDDENQNSFLDTLEPGAHNTPRFPIAASNYNHLALKADYEKDPNYVQDHDYEKDPDYQQKKRFDPPMPPAHLYQGLLNRPGSKEIHYKSPEKSLRPLSEKLPRLLEHDYADTIPHCNSLSTQQAQHNYDYTKLRASTLDPLPHYTHLDIKTKENQRGSGLSYVTTDL